MRFDSQIAQCVLAQLPPVIFHQRWDQETDGWMDSTLRYVSRESASLRPGGETVLTRLADILIIQAIRAWLDSAPEARQGWLATLHDPQIGRALVAIHKQSIRRKRGPWTAFLRARPCHARPLARGSRRWWGKVRCPTSPTGAYRWPRGFWQRSLRAWAMDLSLCLGGRISAFMAIAQVTCGEAVNRTRTTLILPVRARSRNVPTCPISLLPAACSACRPMVRCVLPTRRGRRCGR